MVHVRDTAEAQIFMLTADPAAASGQIFNVGSEANTYQIGKLAEIVARTVPRAVEIEWYGDPDHRSYRVSFAKIEALGYKARYVAEDGVREICEALAAGKIDKTTETLTLEWYKALHKWYDIIREVELHGGLLELPEAPSSN
jgi:nucleoside-diphosphate-sugar epimerase